MAGCADVGAAPRRDVVLTHPGKQHAYEVAAALERAGRLRRFYTSAFFPGRSVARRAIGALPGAWRRRLQPLLDKRSHGGIPAGRVRVWPWAEAVSRTLGRVRLPAGAGPRQLQYPFVNWAFDCYVARQVASLDPPPAAVYGFLGACERTFEAARRRNIATVLDVPIVLDALEVISRENAARGVEEMATGLAHVRIRREVMTADAILAPSEAVARSIRVVAGPSTPISIVPFGVDADRFVASRAPGSPPGRLRAAFAGRLEARKGVHVLLEAWRQVPADWTLGLAGPVGNERYVAGLRTTYGDNVSELGNLTEAALAAFLREADVFVFPSLAEGSALVTYQALAAGLPCIVTAESGSVVRNGVDGFVVPARDASAIVAALHILANDVDLRERMARAARARAETFTWSRYHAAVVAVVDLAISRRAAGARSMPGATLATPLVAARP